MGMLMIPLIIDCSHIDELFVVGIKMLHIVLMIKHSMTLILSKLKSGDIVYQMENNNAKPYCSACINGDRSRLQEEYILTTKDRKSEQIVKAPPLFAPRSGFHLRGGRSWRPAWR